MKIVLAVNGSEAEIVITGDFTYSDYRSFNLAGKELLANKEIKKITINFEQVPFIDDTVFGMMVTLWNNAQKTERDFIVSNCLPQVKQALGPSAPNLFTFV